MGAAGYSQNQGGCLTEGHAVAIARQACSNLPQLGPQASYWAVGAVEACGEGGCTAQWTVYFFQDCPRRIQPFCTPLPPQQVALVNQNCDGTVEVQCLYNP